MSGKPYTQKRVVLYATLQVAVLVICWGWFIALGMTAFVYFNLGDIEYWLLFLAACAGVYGLRPNLERAIDAHWLGKGTVEAVMKERADQLRPVKRRINFLFTVALLLLLVAAIALTYSGMLPAAGTSGT
jgi:hypothetical protein